MKDEQGGAKPEDLRIRTKRYGVNVIALYVRLPNRREAQVIGGQLLRSGTSIGAHYREACRARSDAEFISKMETALQELDETAYWLELLTDSRIHDTPETAALLKESDELIRIFVAIVRKTKGG